MNKGLKNWVIDVVPPRKKNTQSHKGSLCDYTKTAFVGEFVGEFVSETIESVLNSSHDPVAELVKVGATLKEFRIRNLEFRKKFKTNYKSNNKEEISQDFREIISKIQTPIINRPDLFKQVWPVEATKLEPQLAGYIKSEQIISGSNVPDSTNSTKSTKTAFAKAVFVREYWKATMLFIGILSLLIYGFRFENKISRDSELALNSIKIAQANLEEFKFSEAADNFSQSYENFSQAGRNLSFIGAGVLGNIPGLSDLKSAKNLNEAGKLLTSSGKAMSEALSLLSEAGSVFNSNSESKIKPSKIVSQLKSSLELSNKNFNKAKALLLEIDSKIITEDKRKDFIDFKEKLPIIEKLLADASKYIVFLEGVIGVDEHRKYLILFNNYSELRPTGGFPGTYGVISFSNGGLENLFVDDVYNLDGQLKRKIIPPKQLQHITPTWGMRDAAWFIDFPASAQKVMSFFAEEAGYKVDGVIALNPDIISHILKVIGPIEMPEYNVTLTADNFLVNIQEEVEYGENRAQPKTIIKDFTPRLLERLYSANSEQWMEIFKELMGSFEEKDIIFYFEDQELEKFVIDENFGGEIKNTDGDYLMVNFSNIKGSKTDIVTDNYIEIDLQPTTNNSQQTIKHKVTIARKHNGGDREHGFYNKQNSAYVGVLVPEGAEFINISGNSQPNYKPLIDYEESLKVSEFKSLSSEFQSLNSEFKVDEDLAKLENSGQENEQGVRRYEESGKTGFGFWMITDPGETKIVTLEYSVPDKTVKNSFYFQKQPGVDWKNFKFKWNNKVLVNRKLKKDLEIFFEEL